jgi:HK97 family phage portal protein
MDERSRALKEAPLKIFDQKNDEWSEGNEVELLMRQPNPFRTEAEFIETIEQHLSLTGNAFIRKVRDRGGTVRQLWMMQPHLVSILPDAKTYIKGYTYKVDGIDYPVPIEDVIHLLYIDPADDYYGIAPLVAAARRIDADSELAKFTKQLLLNMAVTSGCFVTDKKLNPEEREIMEDRMANRYVGAIRAGMPMVLSHGMKWEQTSMTMKDLEIGNIAAIVESRICLALHVPAIVVGAKVGLDRSTFTNVREAREYMYENTIAPEWQMIADKLGGALLLDFGYTDGNLIARFDTSKIKALQESEHELWERVQTNDSLSIIEKRLKLGYPAEPTGAVFLDANKVAVNLETGDMKPRVSEQEADIRKSTEEKKKNNELDTKDLEGIPTLDQQELLLENLLTIEKQHLALLLVAATRMFEDMVVTFRTYLDQEGIKGLEVKDINVRKLRPEIERIVKRSMQGNLKDVIVEGAEGTRMTLGMSFALTNDEAVKFASKHTSVLAGEIAEHSLDTVQNTISKGIKEGLTVGGIRKRLEGQFTDWTTKRAETVARTETLRAANMGSLEILKKGGVGYKQWIAASDACATCAALNDEVYPVDDLFVDKGDTIASTEIKIENTYMAMPSPPLHPRCRCTIGGIPSEMVDEYIQQFPAGLSEKDAWERIREMRREAMNHIAGGDLAKRWEPAIGEGLQNALRHGGNKPFDFTVRRVGDRVSIYIRDHGKGFLPSPEMWQMPTEFVKHGRGLPTIEALSDSAIIQKMNEGGTLLRMTKNVPQQAFPMPTTSGFTTKTGESVINGYKTQIADTWTGSRQVIGNDALVQATNPMYEKYGTRGIAMQEGDELVGMASVYESEARGTTQLGFLATKRPGYGAHMMKKVAQEAVAADSGGLELVASADAVGFYEKIGMHLKNPGGQIYYWTKEEVAAYAAA